ncbi:N-acetylglucosaminyl deacetylase, LmbE family [Halobacillus karajensis]|uniref:PIG-L deacetylase family protein n=1 Tax=Halobacillus karajensis TaxID=195088 RepID=UPI0008A7A81E|nr:PIG-L family deacetylase [Halobacillus karajensis]SEH44149.1 N-acetylglucosaminyl deacetylase, LmbE family [Halobacillus karajensis]
MSKKEWVMDIARPVNRPLTRKILKNHYNASLELQSLEDEERVLVLAPHMDDETIGPGATLRKHADNGAEIHCLFLTDGGGSVSDLSEEELKKSRKAEIDQVMEILKLADVSYMDLPDGGVSSKEANIQYLKRKIEEVDPDVIYTTPYVDAHTDHTATAQLLADTLKQLDRFDGVVRMYEINCAFPPDFINCLVDTSDQYGKKVQATEVFASQAIAFDGFLELNQLKGNLAEKPVQSAEGFIQLDKDAFIHHCDTLKEKELNFPKIFKQVNRTDTLLWAIFKNYDQKKDFYRHSI